MRAASFLAILALALLPNTGCILDRDEGIEESLGVEERRTSEVEQAEPAPPRKVSADTHLAAGRMLEKQGDFLGAISQYERAIAVEPRLPTAYSQLGIVYQKMGRFKDAEQIFKKGIQADPGSAMLRNNLGYGYLLQNRFVEAEREFNEALRIAPDFTRARMNLAIALGSLGRNDEALEEFKTVVTPDVAHFNVAMLQMNRGEYAEAKNSLQLALAINPDCPGAQDQLHRADAYASGNQKTRTQPPLNLQSPLVGSPTEEATGTDP